MKTATFLRVAAAGITSAAVLLAAVEHSKADDKSSSAASVGLFDAQANKQVVAHFVPQSEKKGTLSLTNRTKQPLTLRVPSTMGAVPVLAQVFDQAFPQPQRVGLSLPQMGSDIFWRTALSKEAEPKLIRVPAGGQVRVALTGVCLDFGNPTPNSRIRYQLVPLEKVTTDARVAAALQAMGEGRYEQPAVQAVAWHLANGKSWKSLKSKFFVRELQSAQKLLDEVTAPAKEESKVPPHKSA